MIEIEEILSLLPHKYPFLLVDRVIEFEPGVRASGLKNVTFNENYFQGHFPSGPIMPGVLLIEAMAQMAAILAFKSGFRGKVVYIMSIEKAKFRRPVLPGDQLKIEINVVRKRGNVWKLSGTAFVDDKLTAEAEFTAMVSDNERV